MDDWISPEALLTEGYRRCAKLTWRYGTTYFWGAALLPKPQRKHVYAVYALCRLADDIVDLPNDQDTGLSGANHMLHEHVEGNKSGASTSSACISGEPGASAQISDDAWTNSAHISDQLGPSSSSTHISGEPGALTSPAHTSHESGASTSSAHISRESWASTSSAHTSSEPDPTLPEPDLPAPVEGRDAAVSGRLKDFEDQFRTSLVAGRSTDPVMAAVVNTVITCGIDPECFERFFDAMAMDLTRTSYQTWEDLRDYMEGSAAVIGEMMLPVLEPIDMTAKEPARSLGLAFQLTNFLRDVAEDLDRGRVYMPQDDLRLFDVDLECREVTPQWRAFMAYEIERNRALYSFADTGIAMLPPRSARCVGTARVLYAQILSQIERKNYDVFSSRARVPTWRKAATAARIMVIGPRVLKRQAEAYQRRSMADVTQDTY
jgi:15-cis-phytoene synthase